jgi:phenylalanyl-tRNA synthetase beta chain
MKVSELWLREWANPGLGSEELCQKLTMAGLEVEARVPVAEKFSNVVIAEIVSIEKHPAADRLQVCQVNVGQPELLTIVCGAPNIRPAMKVPAALVGASLPNNIKITRSKIRGVISHGMLCSERELALTEDAKGVFEFPTDAPIGEDAWAYLGLSDHIIDVSITPNRGDCLSIQGIAREVAAITACPLTALSIPEIKATTSATLTVAVHATAECPHYAGRVITQVKADVITPRWLQERLCRMGVRSINAIVDVMNYVMLELGQPMHVFDLQKIVGSLQIRMASPAEELKLLDGQTVQLNSEALVIADTQQPLAIAGVMGGLDSGVTLQTQAIFLESAFFMPACIARTRQKYNLGSESSYRFERGIDPTLQLKAIERATELLLAIVGGQPGPIIDVSQEKQLPQPQAIQLRTVRVHKILGFTIENSVIETSLQRLGFFCEKNLTGCLVTVPAYRSDILLEIDLIEEVIRLYGYEKLPLHQATAILKFNTDAADKLDLNRLRRSLCDLGYQEIITYSFINQKLQHLFDPENQPKELVNPLTADMTVMRTNLWPGLVNTLLYNQSRQQSRMRLFEIGLRFIPQGNAVLQQRVLSGLVSGSAFPEQWGIPTRPVDYFDLKGDLENILRLFAATPQKFYFKRGSHAALHPGQTTELYYIEQYVGIGGTLHPEIVQQLGILRKAEVFELLLDQLLITSPPVRAVEISKFPEIRRDIAILVDQTIPLQQIQDTITGVSGELLREVKVFDVYQGKGIASHQKSVALALTLQHSSRTLLDEEVADIIGKVVFVLKQRFAAELRG